MLHTNLYTLGLLADALRVDFYTSVDEVAIEEGDLYLHPSGRRFKIYRCSERGPSIHLDAWLVGWEWVKTQAAHRMLVNVDYFDALRLQVSLPIRYRVVWQQEVTEVWPVTHDMILDVWRMVEAAVERDMIQEPKYE